MSDNEKDQNNARDGDDHFLPDGRAIKSGQNIHVRIMPLQRRAFQIMNAAQSVKAVAASGESRPNALAEPGGNISKLGFMKRA
jgi:hypothetical protein